MLGRIRSAIGSGPAAAGPQPPAYQATSGLAPGELVSRLAARLRDYGAMVRVCQQQDLAATAAAALADRGARRVVVPPGLDLVLPDAIERVTDDGGLTASEIDAADGVITTATLAIAETGTIVLDGSPGQGRRALSLIPDYHLCVVRCDQVVGLVPEAIALLAPTRPLTWISGPSATSDIELERVQGVHGPRALEVIVVMPAGGDR